MKKFLTILALTLLCWSAQASTVYVLLSDWLQGAPPLTNYIRITPVALPILGNGGALVTGLPRLFWPTNGATTNSMAQGAYRLEIQAQNWPLPAYFLVGNDTNFYNVTNLLISGGNIFAITGVRQITSTNATISISPGNGVGALDLEVNGSNVTSLNASAITSGTLNDARLNADVTRQGNIFNGASELVQLDSSTRLPPADGSLLFNLNGSNITSGSFYVPVYANSNLFFDSFSLTDTTNTTGTTIPYSTFYPNTGPTFTYERAYVTNDAVHNVLFYGGPPSGMASEYMKTIFQTDSPQIAFFVYGGGNIDTFEVAGAPPITWTEPSDGLTHYPKLVFQDSRIRTIRFTSGRFGGVYSVISNSVWATPRKAKRGMILGDSITEGSYSTIWGVNGYAHLFASMFTNVDWWVQGAGGTGYTNGGPAGRTNIIARLQQDVIAFHPDYVIWALGINDASSPQFVAGVYNVATNCYTQVKAANPAVVQIVVGSWAQGTPINPPIVQVNNALQQAVQAVSGVYYLDPLDPPLITGAYNITNSGNAFNYFIDSSPHPNNAGHAYYADWLYQGVKTLVPDIDSPSGIQSTNNFPYNLGTYDPTNVPGMFMRFEGSDLDSVANGTGQARWTNEIIPGNDFVMTLNTLQPVVTNASGFNGGHSALNFQAVSSYMTNGPGTNILMPFTVIMATSVRKGALATLWDGYTYPNHDVLQYDGTGSQLMIFGNYAGQWGMTYPTNIGPAVYSMVMKTNNGSFYTNGLPGSFSQPNGGSNPQQGFTLNAQGPGDGFGRGGSNIVSCFYVWTNALSQQQIQQIGNYIYLKYGVGVLVANYAFGNTGPFLKQFPGPISVNGAIISHTNPVVAWPTAPLIPGDTAMVNSNGVLYVLISTNGAGGVSSTWTQTNLASYLPTDLSSRVATNDARSVQLSGPSITRAFDGNIEGFITGLNAADYGVTMVSDQTAFIQAMINAATNTFGQVCHLPAGAYYVAGSLVLPPDLIFEGESSQFSKIVSSVSPGAETGSTLYFGANTGTMIQLQGGGQMVRNVGLYSAGAGTAISSDLTAPAKVSQYCTFEHCRIYGFNIGINGNCLENSTIFDCYLTCQTNVYYTNAANANWIIGGHLGGGIYGVRMDAGTGPVCQGNHIFTTGEGLSNAVSIVGTSAFSTDIDFADAEGNTNDVVVNGSTGTKIMGGHHDVTVGGTNFVFVGAQGFTLAPDFVYDGSRAFNIDSTSFGGTIDIPKFGINPTAFNLLCAAQTYRTWNGTNFTVVGGYISSSGGFASLANNRASLMSSNVGTGTWAFTNTDAVSWQCFIGGVGACAVQGVSVNDSQLLAGNSTNILSTVILQPAEWLRITNTTAPHFAFKRF
jgi:lysophospholipase L1-like esterase